MLNVSDNLSPIKGYVELTFRNTKTGEIIDNSGNNMFLSRGMSDIFDLIVEKSLQNSKDDYVIDNITFGDDVGTGTFVDPEEITATYDGTGQNVLYTIPYGDLTINRPNYYTVEYSRSITGVELFTNYPNEIDLRFTSISLNTFGGYAIAYRRFPVRTATRDITIDVKWSLQFQGQE